MDNVFVCGNGPLRGQSPDTGAKDVCLTLMPAKLLGDEPLILTNAPRLSDIKTMSAVLRFIGAQTPNGLKGAVHEMRFASLGRRKTR